MIANKEKTHCEYCKFGEYIDQINSKCTKCSDDTPIVNASFNGCVKTCD